MIQEEHKIIINKLLSIEHKSIAQKLNFINNSDIISDELLYKAIGVIDYYSRVREDYAKQVIIVLSSILYTYKREHWTGLNQFLIIVLSRIGFAPSAIMVDNNFDFTRNQFSAMDSLISQLNTTINQLKCEIVVENKVFLLTEFQKNIWDKCSEAKFIGISAPTSAGKSFVILLKAIKNILTEGGNIVYIVPTLSLITQVTNDFSQKLKEFGLNNYSILTSYKDGNKNNVIYVLTPERTISAYNEGEKPFGTLNTFIVDEIQNIERIENEEDERAKILFDSLVELSLSYNPKNIIFSGPRVNGLKEMGFEIFEEKNPIEIKTDASPVANFTYSISKKGKEYFFNQYSQINRDYQSIKIENQNKIRIGGNQYDNVFFEYLNNILLCLGNESKNIIFAPTSNTARKIALKLSEKIISPQICNSKINSLKEYISETVHQKYDLIEVLDRNIIYHHGKMPIHIRNVLEYAIREKMISNIVCTTTLMQGVNIPTQNVIMRNGNLSLKKKKGDMPKLTNYEISNLRGRAGRLLKDFIGRTFVLDQNAFENKEENTILFQDEEKSLKTGYSNIFERYNKKINSNLLKNISNEEFNDNIGNDFYFLVTYIRRTILQYKENSYQRLNSVGIKLSKEQISQILNNLTANLSIPLEICIRNRYIDPIVLNQIYENINEFDLPLNIRDNKFVNKLFITVNKIKAKFPKFYKRVFEKKDLSESFFYTVNNWVKEKKISEILNSNYFDNSEKIDQAINTIQNDICFNLATLLKPFYSIKFPDSKFINNIEMGAYKPITLQLISLNIPREVAIILRDTIFKNEVNNDKLSDKDIIKIINDNFKKINFWNQIQLLHLMQFSEKIIFKENN